MTDTPDIAAFILDGRGGARAASLEDVERFEPAEDEFRFAWVHLRRDHPGNLDWLHACGLPQVVIDALVADETRPRCTVHDDGVVINLRGVNLNPGAEPEDMISVRFWVERQRVIGIWLRPLMAVGDLIDTIGRHQAPVSPGDMIAKVALRLADRAEPVVAGLNERLDALEEQVLDEGMDLSRAELADVRRSAIVLRRFMVPQRDALTTLEIEDVDWLTDRDRGRIREAAERVTRLGEDLDSIRDRAQVVQDQIADRRSEDMNRNMLLLSVVAAIFLPLGLLTGLLGINVGGIPGASWRWSFLIVCALLVGIAGLQVYLFKRLKIIR